MKKYIVLTLVFGWTLSIMSCLKTESVSEVLPKLPAEPFNYIETISIPPGNPWGSGGLFDNTPSTNRTTNYGATLGRVLFYDKKLSVNNTISCGSCHLQRVAFSDTKQFSTGFEGVSTTRNSMPVFNVFSHTSFFWDARISKLEEQAIMPVKNHIEMGLEDMNHLEKKLSTVAYYNELFYNAFGDEQVTKENIVKALAQFMRSMKSFNSKFDAGKTSNFSNFNAIEREGMELFTEKTCSSCHGGENFNKMSFSGAGNDFANIGLEIDYADKGMKEISGNDSYDGVFKVPSLRNIALTAPYMHDGRFNSLTEVINHYNNIQPHPNLDGRLTEGWNSSSSSNAPVKLNLSEHQIIALVAFLNTLTDNQFINDVRFSDPFKK